MKMSVEELKTHIWEDLGLDDRSIIFCHFDTDYGDAIGSGLVETEDDLYDNDEWYHFCYTKVPNIPSIAVDECMTYMLGSGEVDRASWDDCEYLVDAMRIFKRTFWDMLDEYADILSIVLEKEVPNPAYDVLEDEEDDE